jgi:hypothetical protein
MNIDTHKKRRTWPAIAIGLGAAGLVLIAPLLIAQRFSDGPLTAIIPGGALQSGTLMTNADTDLRNALGDNGTCVDGVCAPMKSVELQLVSPPTSRYVGIMVHDDQVYVPCDLGFMWGRFEGGQRRVLQLIYVFKRWHQDALRDGRVVLRVDGQRFERQAVRVTDPELVGALRSQLEDMARHWVAPEPLADAPTQEPNDIWFFRIDPRPTVAI